MPDYPSVMFVLTPWLPFSHVLTLHPLIQNNKSRNDFSLRDKGSLTWNASTLVKWWGRLMQLPRKSIYSFSIPVYTRKKIIIQHSYCQYCIRREIRKYWFITSILGSLGNSDKMTLRLCFNFSIVNSALVPVVCCL